VKRGGHGDAHAPAQADAEWDFILFYPDMKEAAELQAGQPLRKISEHKALRLVSSLKNRRTVSLPVPEVQARGFLNVASLHTIFR
jgi:hypothetical protein